MLGVHYVCVCVRVTRCRNNIVRTVDAPRDVGLPEGGLFYVVVLLALYAGALANYVCHCGGRYVNDNNNMLVDFQLRHL